jgi:hypothetical protein
MKRKFNLLSACFLSFVIFLSAIADDDWLAALLAKIERFRADYPQEKVYLQFDKPYYSIGDDIWFKAYVVNCENNELSTMSKILYVDLVDERDSVHKTVVLPLANGLANGDIKLTNTLVDAGTYHVRAYTRWMQNFSSDFIFDKGIVIGDARSITNIIAEASFKLGQPGKLQAILSYSNLTDKSPVANKLVEYTLLLKDSKITSGKAVTGINGKVNLAIPLKELYKADKIFLETNMQVYNNMVKRTFAVHNRRHRCFCLATGSWKNVFSYLN